MTGARRRRVTVTSFLRKGRNVPMLDRRATEAERAHISSLQATR